MRYDLTGRIELGDASHFLGVGERLQEEVMPQQEHEDGQRGEQEVPPRAHIGVAVLAVAGEEQVQAVGHAGGQRDGVAEGVGGIKIEGQALRRHDTHDEQHAHYHGHDTQDALPVDLLLEEDRRENRGIDGAGVDEERRVCQRRVLGGQTIQTRQQPEEDAGQKHRAREARGFHLLKSTDKQEDDRKGDESREIAPKRHKVAWSVDKARECPDAAHQRGGGEHHDESDELVFCSFVHRSPLSSFPKH